MIRGYHFALFMRIADENADRSEEMLADAGVRMRVHKSATDVDLDKTLQWKNCVIYCASGG